MSSSSGTMPPRRRPHVATSSNANEGDDVRGAVEFKGAKGPLDAYFWVDKMERAFESTKLPEEKKVKMVVSFLDDSAHHWWTLARRNNDSAQTMTWEQFKALFLGQYFNYSHRSRIQSDFLSMAKRDDEGVIEFEQRSYIEMEKQFKGPEVSKSNVYLRRNSIRVLCNANTSEGFNPSRDVSFPEINLPNGKTHGLIGGLSPRVRTVLAFFAGGLHGPIRSLLLELWENKDEDMMVHQYLPKGVDYYKMMRKSKFCLCPRKLLVQGWLRRFTLAVFPCSSQIIM
ncbi:hypothetical protein ACLB2K_017114 [Fragaria x ananassa]